jgi:DNA polymerase-3 subunit gamma/tau
MAYTALARAWRPRKFSELVGQEHVLRALVNALETGRVHHAFLFTGTRGVGKTTIARIFAKCLNCEKGVTAEPCGECANCREIDSGRSVDLIEVDAASRTKVDDTRELLDNVQYAPTRARYKVYLIDEVHMLSAHSFNALLKTLEEPPPHVKFLLATTDPQKLPVTVLSRCLQFNLKRLPVTQIADHMKHILQKEGISFEAGGIRLVAQAADGSMRDGLSLLDQLIAFGGGSVTETAARAMLGTIARDHVVKLAELLVTADASELMKYAQSLDQWAPDYAQVLDELAALLARVAIKQTVKDYEGDELYAPELLTSLAKGFSAEDVQLYYQTAIIGRRDLALAPEPRVGFEMTLLRMLAFRPTGDAVQTTGAPSASQAGRGSDAARAAARGSATGTSRADAASTGAGSRGAQFEAAGARAGISGAQLDAPRGRAGTAGQGVSTGRSGGETAPVGGAASGRTGESPGNGIGGVAADTEAGSWAAIIGSLELQGAARQLASHCVLLGRRGAVVRLALDPRHQHVRTQRIVDALAQGLSRHFGETVRIEFEAAAPGAETPAQAGQRVSMEEMDSARQSLEADPVVQGLRERFGGTVVPESVRPVK